jgi:hypothetical protein
MVELVEIFDDLFTHQKQIAGVPDWHPGPRSGQQRWLASLAINGAVCDLAFVVDAFPREPSPKFTMSLICGSALVRLDYGELEMHYNHVISGCPTPPTVALGWLDGSHIHAWAENKGLVRNDPLKELEFATPLPSNIQGFANCFRWFCGEYNIDIAGTPIPEIPAKDTLL